MMASITIRNGLPFISVLLYANNQQLQLENVLLDTGAAASVFRTDDLVTIGIIPTQADRIRFMTGIGGREAVIEKQIEQIAIANLVISPFTIQIGALDYELAINGIVGMDFLLPAAATIDLRNLTIT